MTTLFCVPLGLSGSMSHTEQYCPEVSNSFVSATKRKKQMPQNTISFWIGVVVSHAYGSACSEIAGRSGSRDTKLGRLLLHCCLGVTMSYNERGASKTC